MRGWLGWTVLERWMDGQTDDLNSRFWSSAYYHGRGATTGGKTEPADKSQHRHSPMHLNFLSFTLLPFPFLAFFFFCDLYFPVLSSPTRTHTQSHTHSTTGPVELSPTGSGGEGGQSGIYVLQFIFVLEAPRGLSSMLAWGNYTYTPPISPSHYCTLMGLTALSHTQKYKYNHSHTRCSVEAVGASDNIS